MTGTRDNDAARPRSRAPSWSARWPRRPRTASPRRHPDGRRQDHHLQHSGSHGHRRPADARSSTNGDRGDLLAAIDTITGTATASTLNASKLVAEHRHRQNLIIAGTANALTALGLTAGTTNVTPPAISGQTLTIGATGGGTATSITFGTGAGQVSTLNQLNAALAANNLQASINSDRRDHDHDFQQCGLVDDRRDHRHRNGAGGLHGLTAAAPVADPNSQSTRDSLVAQYNQVLAQINTTSQDSSFNGINLLNGDTLNLTFDETGASKLAIQGVIFNDAGLGLSTLTAGTDFLDSNSANAVLAQLNQASTTLRTAASSLGSNLSIVRSARTSTRT